MTKLSLTFATTLLSLSLLAQLKTIDVGPPAAPTLKTPCEMDLRSHVGATLNQDKAFSPISLSRADLEMAMLPKVIRWENGSLHVRGVVHSLRGDLQPELAYLQLLRNELGINFAEELEIKERHQDTHGWTHTRMNQVVQGIKVFGGELIAHSKDNVVHSVNGRIKLHKSVSSKEPHLAADRAETLALEYLKDRSTVIDLEGRGPGGISLERSTWELGYLVDETLSHAQLCFHLSIHPNFKERWEVYVDAFSGEILKAHVSSCALHACNHHDHAQGECKVDVMPPPGPETGTARDLKGVNQTINVWKEGSQYYMIDGARTMFDNRSNMPNSPLGVIWTVDAKNTSPTRNDFVYDHVFGPNNTWNDAASVSAHYNGGIAYEYYKNVHNRESINGSRGNMVSFVHVADQNGQSLGNAFWNGQFMFYGDGDAHFTSLAASLDVAGHEMTHGVVQNTANLEYYGESGAINESMADIFGAMIDRDDWNIGEDVVRQSSFPSGALRSLSNPNNGGQFGDPYWQPKHTNEQYKGDQDNGGVHINSGIPNHAFYLLVQELAGQIGEENAKKKGEKLFYHALSNNLTKSSQFIDLRIAVEESARVIHGSNSPEMRAVQNAFSAVGIGSSGGGNYQNDLQTNPGDQFMLFTNPNYSEVDIRRVADNADFVLSTTPPISVPSVTDDGSAIVFVAQDRTIHVMLRQQNGTYDESVLQNQPIWRNVIVAKDGSRIAALEHNAQNKISVFDFGRSEWKDFELYNPTFSQGVSTGDVLYADAMEFDYTGDWIMYDALSEVRQNGGSPYEYWDVGFLNVWNGNTWTGSDYRIEKLFSGLPENSSIGNPSFSKNSSYIVGFDFIQESFFDEVHEIYSANVETGDVGLIWQNDELGRPNYSISDGYVSFNAQSQNGVPIVAIIELNDDKLTPVQGSAAIYITNARNGVWFANGTRVLTKNEDLLTEYSLQILRNPVTDETLSLKYMGSRVDDLEWLITDSKGVLVESGTWKGLIRDQIRSIDLNGLPLGQYYFTCSSGGSEAATVKFTIVK